MILRTVPLIALPFGFARLKAVLAFGRPGFHAGARFPISGDSGPFLCRFGSSSARMPVRVTDFGHKNRYDSITF
jgi:hypothetical protein